MERARALDILVGRPPVFVRPLVRARVLFLFALKRTSMPLPWLPKDVVKLVCSFIVERLYVCDYCDFEFDCRGAWAAQGGKAYCSEPCFDGTMVMSYRNEYLELIKKKHAMENA